MNIKEFEQEFKEFILLYEKETGENAIYDGNKTEEFEQAFKGYKKQFKQETGNNAIWNGKITKQFKRWANPNSEEIDERGRKFGEKGKDEKNSGTLYWQKIGNLNDVVKRHIPSEYNNMEVIYDTYSGKNNIMKHTQHLLNERFVHLQLKVKGIELLGLPDITKRQVWYIVSKICYDFGVLKDNYTNSSSDGTIDEFSKRIGNFVLKSLYWGEVRDLFNIFAKGRAMLYRDVNVEKDGELIDKVIPLDAKSIKIYENVPFFFIICEKEDILKSILIELKEKRGYPFKGRFYGINTQGVSPADVIKLVRVYKNTKNFHFFILHDLDVKGLEIFFSLREHTNENCKSIAINPEFLDFCKRDFNDLCEKYKVGKKTKTE